MPSPRWSQTTTPPLAAAIAAAIHAAWDGPEQGATNRLVAMLRSMVGEERLEQVEMLALRLYQAQPRAPEGFEIPPPSTFFTICPGCQTLKRTRFTIPQNGRLQLQVLRDADWLDAQFEKGRTCGDIAKKLKCSSSLVVDWAAKHGLEPPRTRNAREFDEEVAARHRAGDAPGTIARALERGVGDVRKSLQRHGIATSKTGQHYHEREWWRVRLEDRRMTLRACTREAGIRPHVGAYWVKKFRLDHITKARGAETRKNGRPKKYPQLYDREQLRTLVAEHGTYEAIAKALGCTSATQVGRQCRKLLGHPKRWKPVPHTKREWWVERLKQGKTTFEMADEAGIKEKSAREQLRIHGLLDQGYRNNYAREHAGRRRAPAA